MKSIVSLFLAVLSLISAAKSPFLSNIQPKPPSTVQEPYEGALPGRPLTEAASQRLPAPPASETDYDDIDYFHYDMEYFTSRADQMTALAQEGDAAAVNALYDELYNEFLQVDSLTTYAMLGHDADFRNEYWTEEYTYMLNLWEDVRRAFFVACDEVLGSGCARSFAAHIGPDTAMLLRGYSQWADLDDYDTDRELQLLDQYHDLYETIDSITFSYEGENWDLDKLYGYQGVSLSYKNYDAYLAIYSGIQQAISDVFAPLYIELVELWTQSARDSGYDSYTDYAYEVVYDRDYTPEDAQRFCDAVKPIAREYYADLYYSDLSYAAGDVGPALTPEELIAVLGDYLPRIAPVLKGPWEQMTDHGLYDMALPAPGRYDGAYTTILPYWRSPFLFATLDGTCNDLITVTHEFGHFADYWFSPQTNMITQTDDLDLSEIHSNALQALFTFFYDEIYEEGADAAEFINISNLLENVIDGCVYDEFQRRVLDEPDGLTPERVNDIYIRVCTEYGLYDERDWDSTWVYISHNFERPLYYISYAASGMAALQIWATAQVDFDAAVAMYLNVLSYGAHSEGYFRVLEDCGLRLFTEEGAVADVCRPVLAKLAKLDEGAK